MSKKCLSIVIVSLNPGERLRQTLESIFSQDCDEYNIVIKDGGSTDGELVRMQREGYFTGKDVQIFVSPDKGIYDAMNQALEHVEGQYVNFMNCGDTFYDETVLSKMMPHLVHHEYPHIIYGDNYNLKTKSLVASVPEINDFALFRNVPCHQTCFYDTRLFSKRAYDTNYRVRADYEHFLYSVYEEKAVAKHVDVIVCNYEGGGFSETKKNRKKSSEEHKEITDKYMGKKAKKYRAIMVCTLAPVRTKIAESDTLSKPYNAIKRRIYKK